MEQITGRVAPDAVIPTFVDRVSNDQRRRYREELPVDPPSPIKRARVAANVAVAVADVVPDPPLPTIPDDFTEPERYEMGLDFDDEAPHPSAPVAPRVIKPSDPALHRFRARRDTYLGALLYRAGRMRADIELCRSCRDPMAEPTRHIDNPLHCVERWNGQFFEACSLKALGLRVQLGHLPHERCPEPLEAHTAFVVLHTNGIHEVAVDVYDCEHRVAAGPPEVQMLRMGWFPATDDRPRTCTTLSCLSLFLLNTWQAKTTAYDFYKMLEKLTDNTGAKLPNRYHAFLRMAREYRHLQMLKRAGRGHDPTGVEGTKPGELAIRCPCCPRPGVNLPENWEDVPPEDAFLYILFLAMDACFRLKRRMVSSELKDPSLADGLAYLVESGPYRGWLLTMTDQKEMSTCSGLAALDYANTKYSRGYSATGVGMGVCARHEFVQPNGVGDLQKGERYANMDYIFASLLRHWHQQLKKFVSYDIVCQWWIHLRERLLLLPPLVRLRLSLVFMSFFSLNLVPGSAQTDREGIERPWANIGGVASSTREMGLGSRADTLNCHWGFWNWQKLVGLAERLRIRTDRALAEYSAQMEAFTTFSTQQAERVPAWRAMVKAYENDPKQKNPYEMAVKGLTEAQVLLQLEQDEAKRVAAGVPSIHRVSPSSFISAALEVEEEQRRVRVQVQLKKAQTTAQQIDIVNLRRDLSRSLRRLRLLQATYTPAAIVALENHTPAADEQPETMPLFLPSALPLEARDQDPVRLLAVIETLMRDAQLATSLAALRNQLHVKARLFTYKELQARNQGANTRMREIVNRNETKIRLHSEKYQMAWEAKRRLEGGDRAKVGWELLGKEDIRCMEDAEDLALRAKRAERAEHREEELRRQGLMPQLTPEERERRRRPGGENVHQVSWIWTGAGTTGTDAELEEALRIEWCKAYARIRRWREETRLLEEEVRRLPIALEHVSKEWDAHAQALALDTMGKQRKQAEVDELMGGMGARADRDEEEIGAEEDEEELLDLHGDAADDEHMLGGGEDD
ncbi:hypothetical protein B0H14DRAFT_3458005 [Mycena olivaceomarginata]|nr:hypothetical protein B0H14DRAFT_3458005 [Mycena olivaceomarginata]